MLWRSSTQRWACAGVIDAQSIIALSSTTDTSCRCQMNMARHGADARLQVISSLVSARRHGWSPDRLPDRRRQGRARQGWRNRVCHLRTVRQGSFCAHGGGLPVAVVRRPSNAVGSGKPRPTETPWAWALVSWGLMGVSCPSCPLIAEGQMITYDGGAPMSQP